MTDGIKRFSKGVAWAVSGIPFLWKGPKLFLLSLVPAVISTGLMIAGIVWGIENLDPFIASIAPAPTGTISTFIFSSIKVLSVLLFGIGLLLTTVLASKILVVPFNSLLAEKTLKYAGVLKEQPFRLRSWIRKALRLLIITITQMIFFAVLGAGILILSFVPFLQFLTWYLGLLIVAFDCADYALECTHLGFREKIRLVRGRLPEFSGFALVLGLTFLIPIINFVFLPLAVIGSARMVATFEEAWKEKVQI